MELEMTAAGERPFVTVALAELLTLWPDDTAGSTFAVETLHAAALLASRGYRDFGSALLALHFSGLSDSDSVVARGVLIEAVDLLVRARSGLVLRTTGAAARTVVAFVDATHVVELVYGADGVVHVLTDEPADLAEALLARHVPGDAPAEIVFETSGDWGESGFAWGRGRAFERDDSTGEWSEPGTDHDARTWLGGKLEARLRAALTTKAAI